MDESIVFLNVGGCYYTTRRTTLAASSSFFAGLVRAHPECYELFVDRDPMYFRHVLNWIRGVRYLPEEDSILQELYWEADYYCIEDMKEAILRSTNRASILGILRGIHRELQQTGRVSDQLKKGVMKASEDMSPLLATVINKKKDITKQRHNVVERNRVQRMNATFKELGSVLGMPTSTTKLEILKCAISTLQLRQHVSPTMMLEDIVKDFES